MPAQSLVEWGVTARVRVRRDEVGDELVLGRRGSIHAFGPGRFAARYMPGPPDRPKRWAHARRRLLAAGCRLLQDGDHEGNVEFDPGSPGQVAVVLRVLGVRRRKATFGVSRAVPWLFSRSTPAEAPPP